MVPGASSPRHSMGGLRRGAAWPRSSYRLPFDGSDQQLYGMDDRDVQAARTSALSDLHETAGIPRRHDRGPRLRDPRDLELQELARDPGLEDAVHPRASAAEVALRELHEPEAGDPPEELPRLLTHALAVGKVAGVVIGHGQLEPAERQLGVREHLRHVARPHGESPRLPHPVTVLLHRRAAPRCVGHDPVDVVGERRHEPSRARTEGVGPSRVELEGAAAPLAARDHDLPPRERQQARRVAVDVGEQVALHAPGQEPDAAAPPPARRDQLRERLGPRHVAEQSLHRGEPREEPERPRGPHETLEPRPPIETQEPERRAHAVRLREHRIDDSVQEAPPRGRTVASELGARRLEERAEADARGTRGLARPAAETEVDVTGEGLGQRDASLGRGPHQVDPAARRVHLLAQHPVRWTLGQADAAVDALPDLLEVGSVGRGERRQRHQSPPTKRPGLSTRLASNSSLSPRISERAPGSTGPHGSTAARTARGARWVSTPAPTGATVAPWTRPAPSAVPSETATAAGPSPPPQAARPARFRNSTRLGCTVESTRRATKACAAATSVKTASQVASNSGSGWSRRVSSPRTPRVPRAPTMSLGTS